MGSAAEDTSSHASTNGHARSVLSRNAPLPKHDHALDHVLLRELRKPRKAHKDQPDSGFIAAARIREVAWDLGQDLDHYRWIATVARELDLPYTTLYLIVTAKNAYVGTRTVDRVARKTSIPVAAFYDPRW